MTVAARVPRTLLAASLAVAAGCAESATAPTQFLRVTSLSAGPDHACATSTDGGAYCWGNGTLGALGPGAPSSTFVPIRIASPGVAFVQIATGYSHACALTEDRQAYCWGWGILGQLGAGAPTAGGPLAVVGGHAFSALTAGWYHTCALDSSGAAWCWGLNDRGQLGDGTSTNRFAPVAVAGGLRFRAISAGAAHTCAITLAGAGYCWGSNGAGQLGNGSTLDSPVPVAVAGGLQFANISAGYTHSCGAAGRAGYCWGSNELGELGNSATAPVGLPGSSTPSLVYGNLAFLQVFAGYQHSCGLAGTFAYCWGAGTWGQLGSGLMEDRVNPISVAALSGANGYDVLSLASLSPGGLTYTCAMSDTGGAFCWGRGEHGELGRPQTTLSALPARVEGN